MTLRAEGLRAEGLVLTCEHGGREVPAIARGALGRPEARRALRGHRGADDGALAVAEHLSGALAARLVACRLTRLAIDANRSLAHPRVFSEWTRHADRSVRDELVETVWRPHRSATRAALAAVRRRGRPVLHCSVHSFTPVLDGRVREVDVGLLYDPSRPLERALCARWSALLRAARPDLRVRRNAPYRGTSDGHVTALRRVFGPRTYAGVELELSVPLAASDRSLRGVLAASLAGAWASGRP